MQSTRGRDLKFVQLASTIVVSSLRREHFGAGADGGLPTMSGDAPRAKFVFQRPTHCLKVRKVRPVEKLEQRPRCGREARLLYALAPAASIISCALPRRVGDSALGTLSGSWLCRALQGFTFQPVPQSCGNRTLASRCAIATAWHAIQRRAHFRRFLAGSPAQCGSKPSLCGCAVLEGSRQACRQC